MAFRNQGRCFTFSCFLKHSSKTPNMKLCYCQAETFCTTNHIFQGWDIPQQSLPAMTESCLRWEPPPQVVSRRCGQRRFLLHRNSALAPRSSTPWLGPFGTLEPSLLDSTSHSPFKCASRAEKAIPPGKRGKQVSLALSRFSVLPFFPTACLSCTGEKPVVTT